MIYNLLTEITYVKRSKQHLWNSFHMFQVKRRETPANESLSTMIYCRDATLAVPNVGISITRATYQDPRRGDSLAKSIHTGQIEYEFASMQRQGKPNRFTRSTFSGAGRTDCHKSTAHEGSFCENIARKTTRIRSSCFTYPSKDAEIAPHERPRPA